MIQTFPVSCPCECGEVVTATDPGFDSGSCTIAACSKFRAAGIVSTTTRKTFAYDREVVSTPAAVRHADGLVWMVG